MFQSGTSVVWRSQHSNVTERSSKPTIQTMYQRIQNVLKKPHTLRQPKRGVASQTAKNLTFPSSKQHSGLIFWDSGFEPQSRDGQLSDSPLVFLSSCRQSKITRPPGDGKTVLWTLLISQPVKKFPAFYETRWFITVVIKAHHLSTLSAR